MYLILCKKMLVKRTSHPRTRMIYKNDNFVAGYPELLLLLLSRGMHYAVSVAKYSGDDIGRGRDP